MKAVLAAGCWFVVGIGRSAPRPSRQAPKSGPSIRCSWARGAGAGSGWRFGGGGGPSSQVSSGSSLARRYEDAVVPRAGCPGHRADSTSRARSGPGSRCWLLSATWASARGCSGGSCSSSSMSRCTRSSTSRAVTGPASPFRFQFLRRRAPWPGSGRWAGVVFVGARHRPPLVVTAVAVLGVGSCSSWPPSWRPSGVAGAASCPVLSLLAEPAGCWVCGSP